MYISDIDLQKKRMKKIGLCYLSVTLFCGLFAFIYERFSHEVYSNYMIYSFMFPLIGGLLLLAVMPIFGKKHIMGRLSFNLYNSGIAALTVGSVVKGALEIYGTTNGFVSVYWVLGFGFVGISLLIYIVSRIRERKR